MPFYLKEKNEFPELERFESVLIVPCRFCPAASMAVRSNEPYFEFFRRFLKTASYEQLIETIQSNLEKKGVKTDVFKSKWLHQFVLCMWTSRRRKKLLKRATQYEALVVLGCEAAAQTVHDSVKSTSCKVFQGMRSEGIMSIQPLFHLPCNISLELNSVTPLVHQAKNSEPWVSL
ncbi:MAG: hypothetical protein ACFFDT_35865 [Candidatus Hodarchaeota archaeon]